jgi:hypothetical protein
VGAKPLFGAQQIPGSDPNLRVAEVSFPAEGYARCEIVKVSSVLDMVDAIVNDLTKGGLLDIPLTPQYPSFLSTLQESKVACKAEEIAIQRGYPALLSRRNVTQ